MNTDQPFLRIACSGCQKNLKVRSDRIGMKFKCPACGTLVTATVSRTQSAEASRTTTPVLPGIASRQNTTLDQHPVSETSSKTSSAAHLPYGIDQSLPTPVPEQQLEALLKRFSGDFPRPRLSLTHLVTAMIVVFVMLALLVLYFAFVAAVGWLTCWHATHNWNWMTAVRGRAAIYIGLIYFGLTLGGGVWVLSMLKPIFRGWGRAQRGEGIQRADHPLLFLFSDRLADIVGSPRPGVIMLTHDVNASASYNTRMFGLMRTDFCLALGLPLVAGLTLPQLAGIIAHEFGHFSQSKSTLLSRKIDGINSWFAQAIYQRDWVDELIESATTEADHFIVSIVGFAMWCIVNLGRGILWCLMWIGAAVGSTLSRQMEYDADQYACGVVGSQAFAGTLQRLIELSLAEAIAGHYIFTSHDSYHLPADYPAFVAGLADQYGKVKKKAKRVIRDEKTSWQATHPPIRDRIAAAERLGQPGIFDSKLSGKKLFRNFRKESEQLTLFLYLLRFGADVQTETLRSTPDAIECYLSVMQKGTLKKI